MNFEKTPISKKDLSLRLGFSSINEIVPIPNLLKISKSSYNNFLQRFVPYSKRLDVGIQSLLKKYFGNSFICYSFGVSEKNPDECLENGLTYSIPLYVFLKVNMKDNVKDTIKKYYIGEIPLLTDSGSFIINGVENTVINQLVRDSGVYINKSKSPFIKTSLKIRGLKGRSIQLDYFYDNFIGQKIDTKTLISGKNLNQNITHQEIDKLLDSFKISFKEIGETFTYSITEYKYCNMGWFIDFNWKEISKYRFIKKNKNIISTSLSFDNNLLANNDYISILNTVVNNKFISNDKFLNHDLFLLDIYKDNKSIFIIENTNDDFSYPLELLNKVGSHLSSFKNSDFLFLIENKNINYQYIFINLKEQPDSIRNSLQVVIESKKKKLLMFFNSKHVLKNDFFLEKDVLFHNFKLGPIGRLKINLKFGLNEKKEELTSIDFTRILRYLIQIDKGFIENDIYEEQSLLNRRFNNIGEHLYSCLSDYLISKEDSKYSVSKEDYIKNQMLFKKINNCRNAFYFLIRYLNKSSLCQYTEQANALSYLGHTRKVSIMGPGGLKNDNISLEMRDVHISTYGKICPIETPEGKSVGVVNNLSLYTRTNTLFQLETPYIFVKENFVTNIIHYLTPQEEKYYKIAHATEVLKKDGSFLNTKEIYCRYLHSLITVDSKNVDYIEMSSGQITSLSASMIPFLEHNDGNRALMGSNMQKQAVPLLNLEKSLIGTGIEGIIGRDFFNISKNLLLEKMTNENVFGISILKILKKENKNIIFSQFVDLFIKNHFLYSTIKHKNSNQKTDIDFKYVNKKNINIFENNIDNIGYSIKNNELSLGNNVLVGFTSMNGHTFEDSIVISERIVRDNYFQSIHLEVYKTMEMYEKDSQEIIRNFLSTDFLDVDGVIHLGTNVCTNDILIGKEKRQLLLSEKNKLIVYDKSIRYKNKKKGVVIQIAKFFDSLVDLNKHYITTSNLQKSTESLLSYIYKEEKIRLMFLSYLFFIFKNKYKYDLGIKKKIILDDLNIHLNQKMNWSFSSFYTKTILYRNNLNIKLNFDLIYKMYLLICYKYLFSIEIFLKKNKKDLLKECIKQDNFKYVDIRFKNMYREIYKRNKKNDFVLLNIKMSLSKVFFIDLKKKIPYSMEFLLKNFILQEMYILLFLYYIKEYNKQNFNVFENDQIFVQKKTKSINKKKDCLKNNYSLRMVKVVVACKHNIQVGDKLTGRYGNKGVISRILSLEDMPYLRDGTPLDIVLSPLGVSSRMNIGQLLECHLGLAGVELSKKLQQIIQTYDIVGKSRKYLSMLYRNKKELLLLNSLNDSQIICLFKNISHGIPISTPIFNSANNFDIDNLLRISGLNIQSKVTIIDGITGVVLDNKVTVGYMYMMKLNHLIDHKIHGRSTGPYNIITQQASKGKSRNGGQRLGEMEVWALQAYGAAYTLQEMLTFKSDSTISRSSFLQNFIRGKTSRIDIPRTFKLLRDELRVLGMELNFIVKRSNE
uniref:DNA-directed RNA polymerase n=1 Tax=Reclinomonas americana TaxID=48483 RepID=O21237_RECAM|nr:RNA polymerase subunit beta [Reclinomonas americana]AAD11864.1 RNA polymerase subunit beta [Reclinomonas americana]